MQEGPRKPGVDPEAIQAALQGVEEPLTVIHAYVDLLLDETGGALSESQRRFLRTIRESTRQLDELLEVLRVLGEADRRTSPPEPA